MLPLTNPIAIASWALIKKELAVMATKAPNTLQNNNQFAIFLITFLERPGQRRQSGNQSVLTLGIVPLSRYLRQFRGSLGEAVHSPLDYFS